MIRDAGEIRTSANLPLSLADVSSGVIDSGTSFYASARCDVLQCPTDVSNKITTTKEFATDPDQSRHNSEKGKYDHVSLDSFVSLFAHGRLVLPTVLWVHGRSF